MKSLYKPGLRGLATDDSGSVSRARKEVSQQRAHRNGRAARRLVLDERADLVGRLLARARVVRLHERRQRLRVHAVTRRVGHRQVWALVRGVEGPDHELLERLDAGGGRGEDVALRGVGAPANEARLGDLLVGAGAFAVRACASTRGCEGGARIVDWRASQGFEGRGEGQERWRRRVRAVVAHPSRSAARRRRRAPRSRTAPPGRAAAPAWRKPQDGRLRAGVTAMIPPREGSQAAPLRGSSGEW